MEWIFLLALACTAFIVWAVFTDRVIYRGFAPVRLDTTVKGNSPPKAIVLPPLHLSIGANVVFGRISAAKAVQIAWTPNAKRKVVLRRRAFGRVRVTYID